MDVKKTKEEGYIPFSFNGGCNNMEFSLIFVFNDEASQILLLKRLKKPFQNLLNGLGGKKETSESWIECAKRELYEESGLRENRDYTRLYEVTKYYLDEDNILHIFTTTIKNSDNIIKDSVEGQISFYSMEDISLGKLDKELADACSLKEMIELCFVKITTL